MDHTWGKEIAARAAALQPELVRTRRLLHQMPETAWEEKKTSAFLARTLTELGYEVITGAAVAGRETGVIGTLSCGGGPVTVLRFDIDALPVSEETLATHLPAREGFSSANAGAMHACGHDGHMAIGLACAALLSQLRAQLSGTIRLIFQPAEEGCRGAAPVVARGWLDDADTFLAGHIVGREYDPAGTADVIPGVTGSLATTKFNVTMTGISCHAAAPECGASAITAMASAILALNAIPHHSGGSTIFNAGRISGGEGRNIIAGHCSMEAEVRGATTECNAYMEERAFQTIRDSAALCRCRAEIEIVGKATSLVSSPELTERITEVCNRALSGFVRAASPLPFRASEDAALMMDAVRAHGGTAAYLLFPTETAAPLHSSHYDFDESVLSRAAAVFTACVCSQFHV